MYIVEACIKVFWNNLSSFYSDVSLPSVRFHSVVRFMESLVNDLEYVLETFDTSRMSLDRNDLRSRIKTWCPG